eukprot:maker-scaffold439_size171548-snap-gene-0.24 protein:Tk02656 transcript:maker-scaffold439_size171548-snap-gene-0.24-mRNA-1 annotation:"protein sda1 homolog"
MSGGASSQGQRELTLLDLQRVINQDASGPELYQAEFERQLDYFRHRLAVFELQPQAFDAELSEHVAFLAHVAGRYPAQLRDLPETLVRLLRTHSTVLDPDIRLGVCRALIKLRRQDLLPASDLLLLFFELFRCPDKVLRGFLKEHILYDLRMINRHRKDVRLNTTLQNFMFRMVQDAHKTAARMALDVMIELYRQSIWRDQKTVNVLATACFHPTTRLAVSAMKFFLGRDEDEASRDDDSEDETPSIKSVTMANRFNKKTRKREKFLANVQKAHKKKRKSGAAEAFNFSALHLINDPQGLAERLFKRVDTAREGLEFKVLCLDLISRLIGTHELFVLNFYPYMARFLNPHQRQVVPMLQFVAQAAHELVPAEAIEPALQAIVNNFVSERNSGEVMAIGLNAVRELCKRCPLAMDESRLRDLAAYKTYKDKAVMMASRSLITLYRHTYPDLLHKKDRGRPTEAQVELGQRAYGATAAKDHAETIQDKQKRAADITSSRILTDADFKRIDATQLRKQVQAFRKGGQKRKHDDVDLEEVMTHPHARDELVDLAQIEMVHKKRKHDKETRMASIKEGREGRDKFGSRKGKVSEYASSTHKEKSKKKNFMMLKHKLKRKVKRSFVEKARDMKRSMLRRQKFS